MLDDFAHIRVLSTFKVGWAKLIMLVLNAFLTMCLWRHNPMVAEQDLYMDNATLCKYIFFMMLGVYKRIENRTTKAV